MDKSKEEYFSKVYDYSYQEVFNVIYSYVKTKYDSEDLLQDTFISFLDKNPSCKSLSECKYWLIRVAINKSINFLKKKKKETMLDDAYEVKDETYYDSDENNLIFNKLTSLPEKLKIVMILYYYDNMKIKDISSTLKISESAVKMRLERGKEQLKKELGGLI
ncbi:RNA polymerase sigma factor [bacterium]|nr:RNA polymerase sigma factor [bacterium]